MPTTAATFRRLATALPDSAEGAHGGHPDFRTAGRVFASLQADDVTAMVRVPPDVQQQLIAAHGAALWPASGAWGRAGCTMLDLPQLAQGLVRDMLQEAWTFAHATSKKARARK